MNFPADGRLGEQKQQKPMTMETETPNTWDLESLRYDETFWDSASNNLIDSTMAKVLLGLSGMNGDDVIIFAEVHDGKMTGNLNFPDPVPGATELQALITQAKGKRSAYKALLISIIQAKDEMDTAIAALKGGLTQRGAYVESKSGGSSIKIESAGMKVRAKGSPVGPMATPMNLRAKSGTSDGTILLLWKKVKGARSHVIEISIGTPDNYKLLVNSTATRYTATGLTSGTRYWFRVAAVGAKGQGGFSDPATKIAL